MRASVLIYAASLRINYPLKSQGRGRGCCNPHEMEKTMKGLGSLALSMAIASTVGTVAFAAPAKMSKRDQAIQECVAVAKAQNPGIGAADPGGAAMIAYKDCMRKRGMRP